jgi:hypothetical protein
MKKSIAVLPLALGIACWLTGSTVLYATDPDLSVAVKQIESHFQTQHTHIPMWGLLKLFIRIAKPGIGLDLALFEDRQLVPAHMGEFEQRLLLALGKEWQPFVRAYSKKDNEYSVLYAKPLDSKFKLLSISIEPREAVAVKLNLSCKKLSEWLEERSYKRFSE